MDRIRDDIYVIDVPRAGQTSWKPDTDEPVSCHVVNGSETLLFGTGHGASVDVLLDALDALGGVDVVVVEHGDADHYGGLPAILDRYGDVTVAAPTADAAVLRKVYPHIDADVKLRDDETHWGLRTISVPGHTAGNMSFLDESRGLLVVGDTVVHSDSEIAAPGDWSGAFAPITPVYNADDDLARENLVVLADHEFETALVTHGNDVVRNAKAEFETLLDDLGL